MTLFSSSITYHEDMNRKTMQLLLKKLKTEIQFLLTCSVCSKLFSNTRAGKTSPEARVINSKKEISWSCEDCKKISNDTSSLKAVIVLLQKEIKQLKLNISSYGTQNNSIAYSNFEVLPEQASQLSKEI